MNDLVPVSSSLEKINQALTLTAQVRGEIACCGSLEDAAAVAGKARSIDDVLNECNASCELRLQAAETYVLAEANLGRWIKQESPGRGRPKKDGRTIFFKRYLRNELGIEDKRRDCCYRLASANGRLEKAIGEVRESVYAKAKEKGRGLVEGDLRGMSVKGVLRALEPGESKERSILRPSDLWTFNPPVYGRIGGKDGHGYLPGDVYCNILWHWACSDDVVAEVMAGSGMIRHVYDDRERWLPKGESLEIDLRLYDLSPRGRHKKQIEQHDARKKLPTKADLIVMDVPYYGIVQNAYSTSGADIANAESLDQWTAMLGEVAKASHDSQLSGGRCAVVVASAYLDTETGERLQTADLLRGVFVEAGYQIGDCAYFGRGIQQAGRRMRFINADAVKRQRLLSEMTHVWMFVK